MGCARRQGFGEDRRALAPRGQARSRKKTKRPSSSRIAAAIATGFVPPVCETTCSHREEPCHSPQRFTSARRRKPNGAMIGCIFTSQPATSALRGFSPDTPPWACTWSCNESWPAMKASARASCVCGWRAGTRPRPFERAQTIRRFRCPNQLSSEASNLRQGGERHSASAKRGLHCSQKPLRGRPASTHDLAQPPQASGCR